QQVVLEVEGVQEGEAINARAQLVDQRLGFLDVGEVVRFFAQQALQLGAGGAQLEAAAAGQGDAPGMGRAQGADDVDARRVAFVADAGAHRLEAVGPGDVALDQVGQLQVFEHEVQELLLGDLEHEVVQALPAVAGLALAATATFLAVGARDAVAAHELPVARMHADLPAALAVMQDGLVDVATGDGDLFAVLHVGYRATAHGLLDSLLDMATVPAQEALPVHRALVLAVQAAINHIAHRVPHGGQSQASGCRALSGVGIDPAGAAGCLSLAAALLGLAYAQIPFRKQAHLLFGIAALHHAHHEIVVLLLVFLAGLGVEADDRQQVLGVGEHLLLDHHAQLLVAEPGRVLAVVVGAGAQHEVDDLVAEVLRVADAGRLLDLLQLLVERHAVEDLAGFRIAVLLVLDPEVGVQHVAVEDVLAVLAVGLQVGGLDLLADELDVARRQVFLEEAQVALAHFRRKLLLLDLLFQH